MINLGEMKIKMIMTNLVEKKMTNLEEFKTEMKVTDILKGMKKEKKTIDLEEIKMIDLESKKDKKMTDLRNEDGNESDLRRTIKLLFCLYLL